MKKFNNKGAALVSVMIAIAFLSIVSTTLLVITLNNYQMKVVNNQSKSNFYETEQRINVVTAQIRNKIVGSTNVASDVGSIINSHHASTNYSQTSFTFNYDKALIAGLAFPVGPGETLQTGTDTDGFYVKAFADPSHPTTSTYDKFYFKDGTVKVQDKTNGKLITIQNLTIKQVSSDETGGYENTIKTDVNFFVEIAPAGGGGGGGVGSCAFLLDNQIQMEGSDKNTRLNISGNTIMGQYTLQTGNYMTSFKDGVEKNPEVSTAYSKPKSLGGKTYDTNGKLTSVNINDTGNATIFINKKCFMNYNSYYNVVFGDILLTDEAVLNVIDGTFTVYGDIFVHKNAAFVCRGKLNMGYNCHIYRVYNNGTIEEITTSTPSKNVVFDGTLNHLDKKNYDKMCDHLKLFDNQSSNDGILPNILAEATATNSTSVKRYCYQNYNSGGTFSGVYCTFDGNDYKACFPEGDLNGGYANDLILVSRQVNNGKVKMVKDAPNSTIISLVPVYAYDTHNINVSKMGDRAFNTIINDSSCTIQCQVENANGNYTFRIKDFFKSNCNTYVSTVFNISTGGGTTSTPIPTKQRISYEKWVKE